MRVARSRLWIAMYFAGGIACGGVMSASTQAFAQSASPASESAPTTQLEGISVTGSRRFGRASEVEAPVPVDVIDMGKSAEQGAQFDLAQTLQYLEPSFTSGRQTGADGADLVDSAALRGLGSDQTLVLVNGKRRHTVALLNLFGARNRGNTGSDFNAIPMLAVDRVEVLRDGAAAQYGSDAIAGVINVILKKDVGCEAVAGYGQYSRGDGENYLASAYCGYQVGNEGVIAMTAEYQDRGRSNRSGADNPRTIGDSEIKNRTFYINGDIPFGESAHFYFNAGLQNRDASSGAFARSGLDSDDIPSRNSASMYPDGFVPFINADIPDRYGTIGVWSMFGDWRADISQTYGYNKMDYTITNTLNASIANLDLLNGGRGISPTRFDAGGFSFRQMTTNFDVSRFFDSVLHGMNVAFGAEIRRENYEIVAGESGSWIDADGPGGGNAGSQGFPGFQPGDETDKSRRSWSVYGDIELDLSERLTTNFAARHEDYSDFGSTTIGKFAVGYRLSDSFMLRGSASTGFRAPSLQQRYFSSTFTDFVSGVPVDVVLAPNGGVIANAAGFPALKQEKSKSFTAGFVWSPLETMNIGLDLYRIDIKDRIALSGRFNNEDPTIGEILDSLGVGEAQFFANSIDTRSKGIDLTFNHRAEFMDGSLLTTLAVNRSMTDVMRVRTPPTLSGREDSFLDARERLFIEEGAPGSKAVLGFDFTRGQWNTDLKVIYFGAMTLGTFSGPPVPNQHYSAKTSADLSFSYAFNEKIKLTVGGTNLFDVFPDRQNADETDNGFKYESVQFGLNGTAYFARLAMKF